MLGVKTPLPHGRPSHPAEQPGAPRTAVGAALGRAKKNFSF